MSTDIDESLKIASTALHRRLRDRQRRVVAVVGTESGAGCTTIVGMMAAWMVEGLGLNPIAIDFDAGRDGLQSRYGLDPTLGLRALGRKQAQCSEVLQRVNAGFTAVALGAEKVPDAGHDAILGLRQLVAELPAEIGPIFIDAPSPLSRADGLVAAEIAGAALLVVPADRSPHELVTRLCGDLAAHRVELLGAVLNYHRHRMPSWLYRRFR